MINSAGQVGVGDRVTYVPGCTAAARGPRQCVEGRVVAPPVADPYASVVWVPTRPDGAADDTEPTWVRHDRLVSVADPAALTAAEDARSSPGIPSDG